MTELGDYRRLVETPMIEAYERKIKGLVAQLERANRIIGWMMPYIGSMCPPQNGLFELNQHCCDNEVGPRMDDETKGPSIRQHTAGFRPSGVGPR